MEEIDQKPLPTAAGLEQVIELGKGTVGRCGACRGCQRDSCGECEIDIILNLMQIFELSQYDSRTYEQGFQRSLFCYRSQKY